MEKKLYRDERNKKIGGVCAGLAEYFDMDVTVIRLLFAFTVIIMGIGLLPYIILWIVLPGKGYDFINYNDPKVDYTVPPVMLEQPNDPFTSMPFKRKSNGGLIFGIILIMLGAAFLLDQLDILPDWDYARLWPVILVVVGIVLIITGQQKKPWEHHDWNKTGVTNESPKTDNSLNDNPPTV